MHLADTDIGGHSDTASPPWKTISSNAAHSNSSPRLIPQIMFGAFYGPRDMVIGADDDRCVAGFRLTTLS